MVSLRKVLVKIVIFPSEKILEKLDDIIKEKSDSLIVHLVTNDII